MDLSKKSVLAIHLALMLTQAGLAQVAAVPPPAASPACTVAPRGLVSWWSGDTNGNDILGGNNPSIINAVTLVSGEVLGGLTFGTQGYLQIPAAANLSNQHFTWTAWVRPDGAGPNNDSYGNAIIEKNIDGLQSSIYLGWRSVDQRFVFLFGLVGAEDIVSTDVFPAGAFYLVTITYDGSAFQLFVNGISEGFFAEAKTITYSSSSWEIGSGDPIYFSCCARTWNGVIDEVQAFNHSLSPTQIQAIYNAGASGVCKGLISAPVSLTFPAQTVGTTSAPKYVKVTNVGSASAAISSVRTIGDFAIRKYSCGSSIPAGATCYVGLTFTPTAIGARTGYLGIASNAPGSPQRAQLNGTGQ